MGRQPHVHIGTSGWYYEHWLGPFYPHDLAKRDLLPHYARHFRTVEINNSFYHLPHEKALTRWKKIVPKGFIFAVKASRFITHLKHLRDAKKTLKPFLKRIEILGDKLGPILFQLPGRWKFNERRLKTFLKALPRDHRYAFEFRDSSWFDPKALDALARHGAAFCIYELSGRLSPLEVTTDFVYVRLHGPAGAYQGQYSDEVLGRWAQTFSTWQRKHKEIYCYFDNDQAGYAAQDAMRLNKMLGNP